MDLRLTGRGLDLGSGGARNRQRDVLGDRTVHELRLLQDEADAGIERVGRQRPNILSINRYRTLLYVVEAGQQRGQRRLSGSGRADQRGHRAGPQRQRNVLNHRHVGAVAEADPVEDDGGRRVTGRSSRLVRHGEFRLVERDLQATGGQQPGTDTADTVSDVEQSGAERGAQQQERQQIDRVHPAGDDEQRASAGDQPQKGRGAGDEIHHGLLAGQRALPVDEKTDVFIQTTAETRRGGTAEDADHRLTFEVGAGLAAHPLGPLLRLRDARAGLDRHRGGEH